MIARSPLCGSWQNTTCSCPASFRWSVRSNTPMAVLTSVLWRPGSCGPGTARRWEPGEVCPDTARLAARVRRWCDGVRGEPAGLRAARGLRRARARAMGAYVAPRRPPVRPRRASAERPWPARASSRGGSRTSASTRTCSRSTASPWSAPGARAPVPGGAARLLRRAARPRRGRLRAGSVCWRRAEVELDRWRAEHGSTTTHVRTSSWEVPLRWFVLVDPRGAEVSLGEPADPARTVLGRRTGRSLVYRTPMSRARRRVARALAVVRSTVDDRSVSEGDRGPRRGGSRSSTRDRSSSSTTGTWCSCSTTRS